MQGFGVLIAVEDTEETLVVRQVSEVRNQSILSYTLLIDVQNSTEILGLSPRYLFSLECFTDTLPESSAGILWDNIQFLIDPTYTLPEDEDTTPHVFVISGWGEPGSQLAHEADDGASSTSSLADSRRYWTCWCAVHRTQTNDASKTGLIVLEFELESDNLNPLYPPAPGFTLIPPENVSQGSGSTSTLVSSPGVSTPGSGSTVVREELVHSSQSLAVPPSSSEASGAPLATNNTNIQPTTSSTWSQYTPHSLAGLVGQDDWTPSAEDILASTTSFAKPIPALERLRRLTRRGPSPYGPSTMASSPSISSESFMSSARPSSPKTGRRPRRRTTTSSGSVAMMDVFAVMAQINEQLGAASNLNTLLKVTVGIIKDLTQFHRVLVYQFDEAWNGQVVAELVDWGVTRDLYRGLHFPASDSPRQVC